MFAFPYLVEIEAIVVGAVIISIGLITARWAAARLLRRGATPSSIRGTRITISVVAVLIAATAVFIQIGPIGLVSGLTFSAIIGLAATLALQTTLGNIIAGFILLQDRMLRMNDTITISGVTGRVVQIGLVTVWLRLEDGSVASMSNSALLSGPMINRSAGDRLKGEY
ncbi:MAG: mechanosensitive ion channel family protein [Thermoplasmata archaeon]|nr:mechanosensitive ion channel family protein [Thermoplasmata archaeon]